MKLKTAGKIILLIIILIITCNEQVYAARPLLKPKKSINIIENINFYINSNQTQNALNLLNKAVLNDPYNPKLFSIAADLFYKNSQYSEAEMLARKAILLNPQDNNCLLILGNILIRNYKTNKLYNEAPPSDQDFSMLNESIKCFNIVSERDPSSVLPHIGLAKIYYIQNNQSNLYNELFKAKELVDNNSDILFEIGELLFECESYEKAIQYLKKSISASSKDDYKAHALLAEIYEKLGNFEQAQNEYIATLKINDSQPEIKDKLEDLNSKIVPVSDVKQTTKNTEKNSEIPDILQADNFLLMNRFSEARELYLKILQKDPVNTEALSGLSELYYAQWLLGYYNTKKYYLDCSYFNNIPSTLSKISILKFKLTAEPKMTDTLEESLEQTANNKSSEYYDKFDATRALFLLGNYINAGTKLKELSTTDITDYDKFKMAKMLYFDQNYTESDNLLKKITKPDNFTKTLKNRITFKQNQADIIFEKGLMLYKEKNYPAAISKFEEELKIFPTDKKGHLYYAYALQKTGNTDKAVEELNIYMNLELLYPSQKPELKQKGIQKIKKSWEK
ncbi:MAG: tetratricopeptide repeat protein [Candidatus Gastranaerophilales bacterium]|nr:tetratricopeptide repeat protein [Candidatus Gastranaerophilales bacterium]